MRTTGRDGRVSLSATWMLFFCHHTGADPSAAECTALYRLETRERRSERGSRTTARGSAGFVGRPAQLIDIVTITTPLIEQHAARDRTRAQDQRNRPKRAKNATVFRTLFASIASALSIHRSAGMHITDYVKLNRWANWYR